MQCDGVGVLNCLEAIRQVISSISTKIGLFTHFIGSRALNLLYASIKRALANSTERFRWVPDVMHFQYIVLLTLQCFYSQQTFMFWPFNDIWMGRSLFKVKQLPFTPDLLMPLANWWLFGLLWIIARQAFFAPLRYIKIAYPFPISRHTIYLLVTVFFSITKVLDVEPHLLLAR